MRANPSRQDIDQLRVCVIIPTYNNCNTLRSVIDGVLEYTKHIIIINDGSTDSTTDILENYNELEQIHVKNNKGKGNALRIGFKNAVRLGYDFAITIDSDGQHFPEDIPLFIEQLKKEEDKKILLIGSRNMGQEGIPKKSSFGNKFSNFWFWIETGFKLQDTQSGYRLYPLIDLEKLNFKTTKFEFEIEVIVKAAWNDIRVKNIPIQVLYDQNERVSHFRPFQDFTRISILNTWFVLVTFFYIKPRKIYRNFKKKGFKKFILEDFIGNEDSPKKKALSIALGVFIGLSPFWGFHTVILIFSAILLKLNKTIAFVFSNISLPPFIPFILFTSYKTGQLILGENKKITIEEITENFEILSHLKTYVIGSLSLAVVSSFIIGVIGYIFFSIIKRSKITVLNG